MNGDFLITLFVLISVVCVLSVAQQGVDSSTIDKAISTLNWENFNVTDKIYANADSLNSNFAKVVLRICAKAVDFMGYAIVEVTKLAMQFAKDNPDIINYKVLMTLILLALIAPIIYPAFTIIVSIILIIREAILNHRDKKALKDYETKRQIRK